LNTASYQKCVKDDTYYTKVQAEHNDVSGFWVNRALYAAKNFLEVVGANLFDDDTVADFGSRTGYVADMLKRITSLNPICVDISAEHIKVCESKGFPAFAGRIENMSFLRDGEVDWGFCSHTLEHVKDYDAAVKELNRVVKRGLFIVIPMEHEDAGDANPSHMRFSTNIHDYITPFEALGWKMGWECPPIPNAEDYDPESRSDYQVWLYR